MCDSSFILKLVCLYQYFISGQDGQLSKSHCSWTSVPGTDNQYIVHISFITN